MAVARPRARQDLEVVLEEAEAQQEEFESDHMQSHQDESSPVQEARLATFANGGIELAGGSYTLWAAGRCGVEIHQPYCHIGKEIGNGLIQGRVMSRHPSDRCLVGAGGLAEGSGYTVGEATCDGGGRGPEQSRWNAACERGGNERSNPTVEQPLGRRARGQFGQRLPCRECVGTGMIPRHETEWYMFLEVMGLLRRPRRTALTLAGVVVGAAAYMSLLAAGSGLFGEFQDAVALLDSDLIVQDATAATAWTSRITAADVAALRRVTGVRQVTEVVVAATRFLDQSYFIIFGLDPNSSFLSESLIREGRAHRPDGGEMMVGSRAARVVGLEVGDEVEARGGRFVVTGVYETGRSILDGAAVLDLTSARRIFSYGTDSTVVFVDVARPAEIERAAAAVKATLPHLEAARSDMWVSTYAQFQVIQRFTRGLGLLALFVTTLWVATTLHTVVLERRAELALLRAVGWTRPRVAFLVLGEGVVLSVLGGMLALPCAALIVAILRRLGAAGIVSATLTPEIAAEGVVVAIVAGTAGCVAPLLRAARLSPQQSLRAV